MSIIGKALRGAGTAMAAVGFEQYKANIQQKRDEYLAALAERSQERGFRHAEGLQTQELEARASESAADRQQRGDEFQATHGLAQEQLGLQKEQLSLSRKQLDATLAQQEKMFEKLDLDIQSAKLDLAQKSRLEEMYEDLRNATDPTEHDRLTKNIYTALGKTPPKQDRIVIPGYVDPLTGNRTPTEVYVEGEGGEWVPLGLNADGEESAEQQAGATEGEDTDVEGVLAKVIDLGAGDNKPAQASNQQQAEISGKVQAAVEGGGEGDDKIAGGGKTGGSPIVNEQRAAAGTPDAEQFMAGEDAAGSAGTTPEDRAAGRVKDILKQPRVTEKELPTALIRQAINSPILSPDEKKRLKLMLTYRNEKA